MMLACLQELRKQLEENHDQCAEARTKPVAQTGAVVSPDTPNVIQAMMQLEQTKTRAKAANKVALEAEKEKDAAENAVEELKRQLQPKRAHTHDDAGDVYEMIAEVDNWDLSVHRREATSVQNSRNVALRTLFTINRSLAQARTGSCFSSLPFWSCWVDYILV